MPTMIRLARVLEPSCVMIDAYDIAGADKGELVDDALDIRSGSGLSLRDAIDLLIGGGRIDDAFGFGD